MPKKKTIKDVEQEYALLNEKMTGLVNDVQSYIDSMDQLMSDQTLSEKQLGILLARHIGALEVDLNKARDVVDVI